MFTIADGRDRLYQWDSDVKLLINEEIASGIDEAHFTAKYSRECLTVKVVHADGGAYVMVPNILLQKSYDIVVYAFCCTDKVTKYCHEIPVEAKPKPADYVYTESEVLYYHDLNERLAALEGDGLVNSIAEYLKENPVQAGATDEEAAQIKQNKQDIEELSREKLSKDDLSDAIDEALTSAKESGEFDGNTPRIGDNGNWWIDDIDTGISARGTNYVLTDADKQDIAKMVDVPEGGTVTDKQIETAVADYMTKNPIKIPEPTAGGMSAESVNLLIKILKSAQYSDDQTANILALETALRSGDNGEVETPESGIEQIGNILSIVSGVTVTQTDNVVTIV